MVANRVCTTDSSSAKPSSMLASAASATGVPASAVIATVRVVPRSRSASSSISVVVPERDSSSSRSYRRPRGISEAVNASVSPCPDCSRAAA